MAVLLGRYTLCNEDCGEGYHNPNYVRCDRCGALIHNAVFEVETDAGEQLIVGSGCIADVLGFRWGKWHEKALELVPALRALWKRGFRHIAPLYGKKISAWKSYPYEGDIFRLPHGLSESLIRAGADLRLWTYYRIQEKGQPPVLELLPIEQASVKASR